MKDTATLATVAAIIAAFGTSMLFFRIQRELSLAKEGEINWIPYSDWLLIFATVMSLLLVILPIIVSQVTPVTNTFYLKLPNAACGSIIIVVTGYIFGILAHYRLIFGKYRSGPRYNPEPAEKAIVLIAAFLALSIFIFLII
ncbi:MAG TPA: hypothetical protein VK671_01330 [Mucilaginibacter sp.]|jgi:hypothetical protein|nr:hypothetical protein [Mucilaginibacter sp.]